ncbi:MAG: peptidase M61, partial [bacterium]
DFVRRFHGGKDSGGEVSTYTYKDVMDGLDAVCHYDWDGFFKKRFYALAPDPPVDGSAAAGWKFVLSDKLNSVTTVTEGRNGVFRPEFGLSLNRSGGVTAVATDSPAFAAGISLGATITAVNDKPFSIEAFNEALTAAKTSPLKVTFTMAGLTTTATIDYKGGIQRPNLERIEGTPDYLTEILRPLAVK